MPPQTKAAMRAARRAWPFILAAWQRWERLPEHEKERYRKMVRDYSNRGRSALQRRRKHP
jgi:hypothetical protein